LLLLLLLSIRFDPIRFRFDSISIGCRVRTNFTQFRISFDSIRLCTSGDVIIIIIIIIIIPNPNNVMDVNEDRKSPGGEERCDSI
jgi:hypothetical protein